MKKDRRKARRVMKLQRRVKYAGTRAGPSPDVFSLCIPRDVIEALGLEPGDAYRFRRLGRVLAFVPVGAAE